MTGPTAVPARRGLGKWSAVVEFAAGSRQVNRLLAIRMLSPNIGSIMPALALLAGCAGQPADPVRGFAPDEAYLEGSEFPYFGSETPWNLRFFTEHTQVKRNGQRQMLYIVQGNPEKAVLDAEALLAENPTDQESLFNLAVARTQLGELDLAMSAVHRATEAGLPMGRFIAGPRDLLAPLAEHEPFRREFAQLDSQLLHGPMVGAVTETSARIWLRTAAESDVKVVTRTGPASRAERRSDTARTSSESDYTAVVEINGLEPDSAYSYDVIVDGRPALGPDYPAFRTFPTPGEPSRFKVGFGGGAGYVPRNERMWDVIRSHDPLAFLFLGDNVYLDYPVGPTGLHYYTYYRRQSREEFRRLTASTAIYAIWDDHDCATDDVWMGPYRDRPHWKLPAWRQFRENWVNPGYGSDEWPGVWFAFSIGDVDFFMLDGRFYRTNPYASEKTLLGPAQKRWLFDQVKRSRATFKVLVSPVPWSFDTKGDAVDTWNGFREERAEIFDFLADNEVEGVFLLSADRHRSDARRIDRSSGYPLFEFESSRLTNEHAHRLMPGALFGYNEKQSFGLLQFDMGQADPTVTFRILSIDNEVKGELVLKRSQLSQAESDPGRSAS